MLVEEVIGNCGLVYGLEVCILLLSVTVAAVYGMD